MPTGNATSPTICKNLAIILMTKHGNFATDEPQPSRPNDQVESVTPPKADAEPETPPTPPSRFRLLVWRALKLRCPQCGKGQLFAGWFAMNKECDSCRLSFQREPGFFLGSIYFNYGLTALITAILYPLLRFAAGLPNRPVMVGIAAFAVIFPVWFFRYARSLWFGFDQWIDPHD